LFNLGKILNHTVGTLALSGVYRRGAHYYFAIRDVVDYARLSPDCDLVSYGDVPDDARLAPDNAVMPHRRRAGDTHLCYQQTVRPDPRPVPNRNQIAQLAALPDNCVIQRSALDPAACAYLNVILYYNAADLRYLVMNAVMRGETETVFAD
jgi:hypothetical protein